MHEGRSMTWREVAEKHHAAFIDEMQLSFDASMRTAVSVAVEEVRKDAQQTLTQLQTEFETRFEAALRQTREDAEKHFSEQSAAAEMNRQQELTRVQSEAQAAVAKLTTAFEDSRSKERDEVRESTQAAFAEHWNQFLRRLRDTAADESVLGLVAEYVGSYADRAVMLQFDNQVARIFRFLMPVQNGNPVREFSTAEAPALVSVIETSDPVIALAVENEISPALVRILEPATGEKAYLFPLRRRQTVVAVIVANGNVKPAVLELLSEAASFQLTALAGPVALGSAGVGRVAPPVQSSVSDPGNGLVQLAPPSPLTEKTPAQEKKAWDQLDSREQKLHLQAQRYARVQVAEMRLYKHDAVRQGVGQKNLYQPLKLEIDEARKEFLHRFLSISPSMVDYLHLEILRSLANDDDRLLGHEYPGPMV